ncbi:SDR family oxidoreductase [Actinocrispum sp. NPDC049592]|uniref:SDR family oxidoreductase n=1 Tax=Actinocrispum sp. NPDC049592 TaxID=3154835 RepID=UPI0034262B39
MKIVVIGGTGLIGSKLVTRLSEHGHTAVPASPNTGVDTLTGEGLKEVLTGADVVIDVSNSPSFADDDVMNFFRTSAGNLVAGAKEASIGHFVALSVVSCDRLPEFGYMRAKVAQEELIRQSGLPYSIVRATQFFEFAGAIADSSTVDGKVHLAPGGIQPMAADDVASAVGRTAAGAPLNATVEYAGPEVFRLDEWIRTVLSARSDGREVVTDPKAPLYGGVPGPDNFLPVAGATLAKTTLQDWLSVGN